MRLASYLVLPAALLALAGCSEISHGPGDDEHHDEHHDEHQGSVERLTLSPEAAAAAEIVVEAVARRELQPTVQVTGTLGYDERHMGVATARIGGRIDTVVGDYGQSVGQGEVLAWIDSPELGAVQVGYRRALEMTRLRRAEYERAELLLEGQAISRGELLRREADWRAARAELETAEQQLHILGLSEQDLADLSRPDSKVSHVYPVRAPLTGRITERKASPGRVVSADEELFVVADLDSLWLFLQVFEKDLHAVREGARVSLSCESHPEDRFSGVIDFVGQVLDEHTRTAQARAVIDNGLGKLRPGMFVYAHIEAGKGEERGGSVLAVPEKALTRVEGRHVVFVEAAERQFELREVTPGEIGPGWVEIRSGLREGERIAVTGVFVLKSEVLKGGLEGHQH